MIDDVRTSNREDRSGAISPDEISRRRHLETALIIPAVTALLYAYSFAFEAGYAAALGYPAGFVPIGLDLILNIGTALFVYVALFVGFLQLNLQYWPAGQAHTSQLIGLAVAFFASMIALNIWFPGKFPIALFLTPLTALVGIRAMRRWEKTPIDQRTDKVPNVYDARGVVPRESVAYALMKSLGFDPVLVAAVLLLVIPLLFAGFGYGEARSERTISSSKTQARTT